MKDDVEGTVAYSDIQELQDQVIAFRDERDWKQFHNAKDLSLQVAIEASELVAEFLWKGAEEANLERVQDELADVLISCFLVADCLNVDVRAIVEQKMKKNTAKYPADKARGRREKYTELG